MKCGTYILADDTKIFITTKEDAFQLQSDINSLELWSQKWPLTFHTKKCHVLTWKSFITLPLLRSTHFIDKSFWHFIDKSLCFWAKRCWSYPQCRAKISWTHFDESKETPETAELIHGTFSYLDGPLFKKLFTTFLRPHLEYGQLIWTLHFKNCITILENVQRQATKYVDGFHHTSYSEILKKLNVPSLVCRRAQWGMIELSKHLT